MTARPTPRLAGYAGLTILFLVAALVVRRPELVCLAVPFALVLAVGLTRPAPRVRVGFALDRNRTLAGDPVAATLDLSTDDPVDRVEVALVLPQGVGDDTGVLPVAFHMGADDEREVVSVLRTGWGAWTLGDVRLRTRDRYGLYTWEQRVDRSTVLRTYPRPEQLRALVSPAHTQAAVGSEPARVRAEGLEFADTRPFVAGDRVRAVNWRASARTGELVVNERHPERNADVVLFLDSFSDAGPQESGLLGQAVRAAATLAELYLQRRDRVGLVTFGGTLRWLEPAGGMVQHYRLVEALLETKLRFSYAWKDVNVLPARTLPPRALVVAITPLLDPRGVAALLDLRARGFDLAAIEVSADRHVVPGTGELDDLALRLWHVRRTALRAHLHGLGVAVSTWDDDAPLEAALEGVRSFRRHARLVRR